MVEAFDSIAISLPLYDGLEQTNAVKPPPLYRQAEQSRKRSKVARDFATGKRRTPNREFFNSQVKDKRMSKREIYTCSRCQEVIT
ncbi:hypothetical protein L917_14710 [Phytophthora nicotianae]|uniref:Uncharacterized protein n=1 Tax=Phytophthora nicotianae TaxID=4792 RepID=W2KKV6_PHYNI|nr:hypothetical protein L917_14710 [Phytophthora nicotianae]